MEDFSEPVRQLVMHEQTAEPSMQLTTLPAELLRSCLAPLNARALLRAGATCRLLHAEARATELWAALIDEAWPAWTLLRLFRPDMLGQQVEAHTAREYRARHTKATGQAVLAPARGRVFILKGHARDNFDGNVTPMMITLCRAPSGYERIGVTDENIFGEVQYAAGTMHNEPRHKIGRASCRERV